MMELCDVGLTNLSDSAVVVGKVVSNTVGANHANVEGSYFTGGSEGSAGGSSFNSGAETAVGVGPGEGSGRVYQGLVFDGQVSAVSSLDGPAAVHFGVGALGGSLIAVDVDIILGDLAAQQQSQFFFGDVAAHTAAVGVGSTQGYVVERVLLGCAGGHNKMTSHQAEYQDQRQQFAQCCVALHDLSSLNIKSVTLFTIGVMARDS